MNGFQAVVKMRAKIALISLFKIASAIFFLILKRKKMIPTFEFLLIKDPHFMFGFRNNVRKYGWEKDIDSKIDQIVSYALQNNITNIFFTGDIFEKNKKKDWSFNQLQQNKNRLKKFKRAGLTIYSNQGNHDMFDGRETIEGTVFGEMVEAGLVNYIGTGMKPIEFNVSQDFSVYLYGIDYHQNIDKVLDELERIATQPNFPKIVLMHSNITDTKEIMTDFTYDQISKYDIDIIGCGHWHFAPSGGTIQNVNNTYFLNPWNLTRVVRDYHVKLDEHKPEFIHGKIIKIGDEFTFDFQEIFLETRPFSEAFNTVIINMLQELGKSNFEFFNEISLDEITEENDDFILLQKLQQEKNISEESFKIAKKLLGGTDA